MSYLVQEAFISLREACILFPPRGTLYFVSCIYFPSETIPREVVTTHVTQGGFAPLYTARKVYACPILREVNACPLLWKTMSGVLSSARRQILYPLYTQTYALQHGPHLALKGAYYLPRDACLKLALEVQITPSRRPCPRGLDCRFEVLFPSHREAS